MQKLQSGSRHTDGGFTLIEVMIALVVLLVGMLGVMGMQYYSITGNTTSREMRIATSLSQDIIEQLKTAPYADMASSTDTPLLASEKSASGGQTFTRRWWVLSDCVALDLAANADPCNAALAAVCVQDPDAATVVAVSAIRGRTCWTDKNGNIHSVSLDSLRWNENAVP